MRKTRWLAAFVLPLLLVSFLQSQSLAELAKKEKERRAALKGKTATVITPVELAKVKKRPAVETTGGEQAAEAAVEAGTEGNEAVKPPVTTEAGAAAKAGETMSETQKPAVEAPPGETGTLSEKEFQAKQAELMKAVDDKQDMVDLLTLKLNALYQQFNNLDNMQSREFVQSQISETYDKLLKAEAEAKKASKDLDDFVAKSKRENAPGIWIK